MIDTNSAWGSPTFSHRYCSVLNFYGANGAMRVCGKDHVSTEIPLLARKSARMEGQSYPEGPLTKFQCVLLTSSETSSDSEPRSRYRNSGHAEQQRVSSIVVPNFVHSCGRHLLDLIPNIVLLRANIVQKSLSRRF